MTKEEKALEARIVKLEKESQTTIKELREEVAHLQKQNMALEKALEDAFRQLGNKDRTVLGPFGPMRGEN
jgi:uncharacterized coiled-coil protein SlyX